MSVKVPIISTKKSFMKSINRKDKGLKKQKQNVYLPNQKCALSSISKTEGETCNNLYKNQDKIAQIVQNCIEYYIQPLREEIDSLWREIESHKMSSGEYCNNTTLPANEYDTNNASEKIDSKHIRALSFKIKNSSKYKRNNFNEEKKYTSVSIIKSKSSSKINKYTRAMLDDFRLKKTHCMTYCIPDTDENVKVADLKPTSNHLSRNKQMCIEDDDKNMHLVKSLTSSKSAKELPFKIKEDLEIK